MKIKKAHVCMIQTNQQHHFACRLHCQIASLKVSKQTVMATFDLLRRFVCLIMWVLVFVFQSSVTIIILVAQFRQNTARSKSKGAALDFVTRVLVC